MAMKQVDLGKYILHDNGKIVNKKNGKVLKPSKMPKGYLTYQLNLSDKTRTYVIHRLVYRYFIGEISDTLEVNHKDGNKENNHYTNLELVTHKENMQHAVRIGLIKSGAKAKNSKGEIVAINPITKELAKEYGNARRASIETGIPDYLISMCLNGHRLSAGGYLWIYKKDINEWMDKNK
jgi:hypothetical protein